MKQISTFSIVAYDEIAGEWGVAVQSRFFAVATIVPWAEANTGALATQAIGNPAHWTAARPLLSSGMPAESVMEQILKNDRSRHLRQIGIIDRAGNAAAYTGPECVPLAGFITGPGYTVQGNFLLPGTLEAMEAVFLEKRNEKMDLSGRLAAALSAGQKAGGDKRGMQSAGILVVKENAGYAGSNDRYIDLRVDDHPRPLEKLDNLLLIHKIMYGIGAERHLVDFERVAPDFVRLLKEYGITGDGDVRQKITAFLKSYNIGVDLKSQHNKIDVRILEAFHKRLEL